MIFKRSQAGWEDLVDERIWKTHFKYTAYVNFDNNRYMEDVFEMDYDIERIIMAINIDRRSRKTGRDIDLI